MTPALLAISIMTFWAFSLAHPALGWTSAGPPRFAAAAGGLWLLLNFFAWMVPKWRTHIITTRGPLLGFGFAFAAALVSAGVDAFTVGAGGAALLFVWRAAVLALPFALALKRRLKPYPHSTDLVVAAFAWLLPLVPGFGGAWFTSGEGTAGLFGIGTGGRFEIGPGRLIGLGLLATYFYGARPWTAAALDWKVRQGDAAIALRMGALAALGAALGHAGATAAGIGQAGPSVQLPAGMSFWSFALFGLTLAPAAEELTFRAVLQAGVAKMLPKGVAARWRPWTGAAVAAALHALFGSFGLSAGAAAGLALGLSLAYPQVNRLLPALLAHVAAWALLYGASAAMTAI